MLDLKLRNCNVKKFIDQVKADPEFYMGEFYKEFSHMLSFSADPIFAEVSTLTRNNNSDVVFIPLVDGFYFCNKSIKGLNLKAGETYSADQVLDILEMIQKEYEERIMRDYYYCI